MLWDTSLPQLYSVRFQLHGGEIDDVVHSYFGMRSLSAETVEGSTAPGTLCLNGEPIYLRGALYQSYYPDGIYTAGDTRSEERRVGKECRWWLGRVHER